MNDVNISLPELPDSEDELEALLLEGLEGPETVMTASDWQDIRKQALERLNNIEPR